MKTYNEVLDELIAAKYKLANIVGYLDLVECPKCNNYHHRHHICYQCGYDISIPEGENHWTEDEKIT